MQQTLESQRPTAEVERPPARELVDRKVRELALEALRQEEEAKARREPRARFDLD